EISGVTVRHFPQPVDKRVKQSAARIGLEAYAMYLKRRTICLTEPVRIRVFAIECKIPVLPIDCALWPGYSLARQFGGEDAILCCEAGMTPFHHRASWLVGELHRTASQR